MENKYSKNIKCIDLNTQFIGGYMILDLSICDKLLEYFNEQKKLGKTKKGSVNLNGTENINKKIKESIELNFNINEQPTCFNNYLKILQLSLDEYIKQYQHLSNI